VIQNRGRNITSVGRGPLGLNWFGREKNRTEINRFESVFGSVRFKKLKQNRFGCLFWFKTGPNRKCSALNLGHVFFLVTQVLKMHINAWPLTILTFIFQNMLYLMKLSFLSLSLLLCHISYNFRLDFNWLHHIGNSTSWTNTFLASTCDDCCPCCSFTSHHSPILVPPFEPLDSRSVTQLSSFIPPTRSHSMTTRSMNNI